MKENQINGMIAAEKKRLMKEEAELSKFMVFEETDDIDLSFNSPGLPQDAELESLKRLYKEIDALKEEIDAQKSVCGIQVLEIKRLGARLDAIMDNPIVKFLMWLGVI